MKVQQMLNSLPILQRVIELKLPIKKAHKIYLLAKTIEEQREFFAKEEGKLIAEFNAEILENGNIKFNSSMDQQNFTLRHAELLQYEVEGLEVVNLTFDDLGDVEFTPKDIMMLEGVINFIE